LLASVTGDTSPDKHRIGSFVCLKVLIITEQTATFQSVRKKKVRAKKQIFVLIIFLLLADKIVI